MINKMKMNKYLKIITVLLLSQTLQADNTNLGEFMGFSKVKIKEVEKDGIIITHSYGARKVPIEELPKDLVKKLGMSMEGVKEYRMERAKAKSMMLAKDGEKMKEAKAMMEMKAKEKEMMEAKKK